jgi:hypothetical protein
MHACACRNYRQDDDGQGKEKTFIIAGNQDASSALEGSARRALTLPSVLTPLSLSLSLSLSLTGPALANFQRTPPTRR